MYPKGQGLNTYPEEQQVPDPRGDVDLSEEEMCVTVSHELALFRETE